MQNIKGIFISLLLCLLFWVPSTVMAYTITEGELTQLEQNLTELEKINYQLIVDLGESKRDLLMLNQKLEKVERQLQLLQNESTLARTELEQANKSLEIASKSFKRYEKEVNKLKFERNILLIGIGYLALK